MEPGLVLLYDGLCGFCNSTVRFILDRDPGGSMRFAALQGEHARAVLAREPAMDGVDSLVLIESGEAGDRILIRSEAVLRIARYLGGPWRIFGVFRLIPRPVRDFAYASFARFRYTVFGQYNTCPIPPAETRQRFID